MRIKRNIRFVTCLRHSKSGPDNYSIRLRISWAGLQQTFATGITVPVTSWDKSTSQITGPDSDRLNAIINDYSQTLDEIMQRFELIEKRVPDIDELTRLFDEESGAYVNTDPEPPKIPTVHEAFDEFMLDRGDMNSWTEGTHEKFRALQKKFDTLDPNLQFSQIDDAWLSKFIRHLIDQKFKNTTIQKNIAFIRWFLRWAVTKEYYLGKSHETFRPKLKGSHFENKTIIFLTEDELQKLHDHEFADDQQHLARVRDIFLFACYSGLRFSDISALRRSQIQGDMIRLTTKKTDDNLDIELNRHTKEILARYADTDNPDGKALPVVSNQKTNEYLKTACKVAGIKTPQRIIYFSGNRRIEESHPKYELITFHAARRTFITQALRLGIPIPVIMKWSGHKDMKMLKPYMEIVDELKAREMKKFDQMA